MEQRDRELELNHLVTIITVSNTVSFHICEFRNNENKYHIIIVILPYAPWVELMYKPLICDKL